MNLEECTEYVLLLCSVGAGTWNSADPLCVSVEVYILVRMQVPEARRACERCISLP